MQHCLPTRFLKQTQAEKTHKSLSGMKDAKDTCVIQLISSDCVCVWVGGFPAFAPCADVSKSGHFLGFPTLFRTYVVIFSDAHASPCERTQALWKSPETSPPLPPNQNPHVIYRTLIPQSFFT